MTAQKQKKNRNDTYRQWYDDTLIAVTVFFSAIALCFILNEVTGYEENTHYVPLVFVLAVAVISRLTSGYFHGILTSFLSVFFVNYYFTYPYRAFNFTLSGYPLTFVSMLAVSLIISAASTRIKRQEELRIAAEKERIRANLLRAVSHDIRTPLTSIVGSSALLSERGAALSEADRAALLTDIHDDAQWLVRVVENLLSVTRISGETKLQKEPELAEDVTAEATQKLLKLYPNVRVNVSVPEEVVLIPMDAVLIVQVLFNLLENAVLHGKETTEVRITVTRGIDNAVFSVWDDGGGIAESILPHLFDGSYGQMWKSAPDARRNMGIGLSVCASIVEAHGGKLRARNREGGAEFIFTLPMEGTDL